jgi:hypothetical protein
VYRKMITTFMIAAGWYLMLPPAVQHNGVPWPDNTAPLARWSIAESFDTAKACEAELAKNRKHFSQSYRKTSHKDPASAFWPSFYVSTSISASCIASDDVRLKESADEGAPDLKQSTAVQPPGN